MTELKNYGVVYELLENDTYKLTLNFTYAGVLKFDLSDERNRKISKLHYMLEFDFQPPEIADFDEEFEKIVDKSFIEIAKHGHLEEISTKDVYPKTNIFLEAIENCEKLKIFTIQQDSSWGFDDQHFYFNDKVLEKILDLPNIENIWLESTILKNFPENKNNNTLKEIGLCCNFYKKYISSWSVEFTEPSEISKNISTYKTLEKLNIFKCNDLINSIEFFELLYDELPNLKHLHISIFKTDFENEKVLEILDKFKEKGVQVKLNLI